VARAALETLAEQGTYDVERDMISSRAGGVEIVTLEEAAMKDGVVYDPFGKRVTLYAESDSGRWFCLDLSPAGKDYGFGDSFPSSLASCTDDVLVSGWGDAFSPTGPDEAAISGVWGSLALFLEQGEPAAAHALFVASAECTVDDLTAVWPPGVSLLSPDDYSLEAVTVAGSSAVSDVTLGSLAASGWRLENDGASWLISVDPCEALAETANQQVDAAARQLIESGLFAVRSVFVVEQDFAFGMGKLETIDGDLIWVEQEALEFGQLSYTGRQNAGLVITKGAESYLCAVESSTAATRYGAAKTLEDVSSTDACRSGS
jgi:hypothetical protein